ncbi:MAG: AraC family transcriptional regulator [Bacteroidetes bacterium]|nr:AraC family transcriptional regulator [Bacteroidota bacterium]MBU1116430.1 AraC family transcriptional regulator [Bacteroidota bacterium]MBU1800009.1 AraC family transcriptional regulator [Bacteroidota bacterium]
MLKSDGFRDQRSIILPKQVIKECNDHPVIGNLYVTDIGVYPCAKEHFRKREEGCEQYILIYCTSGKGWIKFNKKKVIVNENEFFILPPNISHTYGADSKSPWSIYWLHFSGSKADYFNDIAGKVIKITISKIARVEDRAILFEEIFQNLEMGYSIENLEYSNLSLWHFLASFKFISQFRHLRKIQTRDPVENSILFMKNNLRINLTLEMISAQGGLSSSHFSTLFRSRTGRSPIDYFINLKIQHACHILDTTKMRIKEVSQYLSYDDPYYFSRIFSKIMGISPIAYRKLEKG